MSELNSRELKIMVEKLGKSKIDVDAVCKIEQDLSNAVSAAVDKLNKIGALKVSRIRISIVDVSTIHGRDTAVGDIEIDYFV